MYQDTGNDQGRPQLCIECGSSNLIERMREQRFPYGPLGDQVILTAAMPVITCEDCGYEYFDERGESARHAAVCRHLGVQTPEEIRKVREENSLTRVEFCQLTGFGSASLQRWEAGEVVPNASSDRLIFLLRYAGNIERLKRRRGAISQGLLPCIAEGADPLTSIGDPIPEARTRCAVKRFRRFEGRSRIALQAATWNLRRGQCT